MTGRTNSQLNGGYPDNYFVINRYQTAPRLFRAFSGADLPNEFTIDMSKATASFSMQQAFWGGSHTGHLTTLNLVGDTSLITNYSEWLSFQQELTTITGELNFTNNSNNTDIWNWHLNSLKDLTIAKNGINKSITFAKLNLLTAQSAASIVNGLVDLTGETSQTLTLHANTKALLTAEQIATITAKNWTLA